MKESKPTYPLRLIDARDLAELRQTSMSSAYEFLKKIKNALGKKPHQYLTNREVAKYLGLKLEDFETLIGRR
ncbi:MAG TPA: hypothetical protein VK010_01100 [Flavobacteriaceae bacterium]|nr:hypothetical protein [Flavobacteriaceae bacterium]